MILVATFTEEVDIFEQPWNFNGCLPNGPDSSIGQSIQHESEGWGFESPSGRDIFCLKNFDTFTRTPVYIAFWCRCWDIPGELGQYQGCWCPGNASHQVNKDKRVWQPSHIITGIHIPGKMVFILRQGPGPWFNIKMSSYQYRKSHCGNKTILWPSYPHNGISYTGKTFLSHVYIESRPRFLSLLMKNFNQLCHLRVQKLQTNIYFSRFPKNPA